MNFLVHLYPPIQPVQLRINPPKDSETTTTIPSPDAPEYIIKNKKEAFEKKGSKQKKKKKI